MRFLRLAAIGGIAALAATFSHTPSAVAAPMSTDLATVRSDATTIVLGTVRWVSVPTPGAGVTATAKYSLMITVDATLRGTAPAVLAVDESPDGHVTVDGERVVAFVDAKNRLRWVGRKIAGPDLEHGVLQLSGFFDFNAHLVRPSMMTLPQLKGYLATGNLHTNVAATIAFPDGHGGLRPSTRHLGLDWDPFTRVGTISGFTPDCLSLNTVFGMEWGKIELVFTDTCHYGTLSRELTLEGEPTGVDASGAITADLVPTRPLLAENEFDPFVTDGHVSDVHRVVRVTLSDGSAWSWRLGDALVDPGGKVRASGGAGSSIADKSTATGHFTVAESYWTFADVTLRLSKTTSTTSGHVDSLGNDLSIVGAVDAGGWTCSFTRGGTTVPCTLRRDAPVIVRR